MLDRVPPPKPPHILTENRQAKLTAFITVKLSQMKSFGEQSKPMPVTQRNVKYDFSILNCYLSAKKSHTICVSDYFITFKGLQYKL